MIKLIRCAVVCCAVLLMVCGWRGSALAQSGEPEYLYGDPEVIASGNLLITPLATLPSWTAADEGRLVYTLDTDTLYYGDDAGWVALAAASCYWERTGTVLSPDTAGDRVSVAANSSSGAVEATATGAYTGVRGVSDTGPGVYGASGGSGGAVQGLNTGAGPGGSFTGGTGTGNGLEGIIANTNNGYYSVAAVTGATGVPRTMLGNYADVFEAAAPATPNSGKGRLYTKSDNHPYWIDDTGTAQDLGLIYAQTYYASQDADGSGVCNINWASTTPYCAATVALPTDLGAKAQCTFTDDDGTDLPPDAAGNPLLLSASYAHVAWTSSYTTTPITLWTQAVVVFGVPVKLMPGDGGTTGCKLARVSGRFKVNNVSRFNAIKLTLSDSAATPNYSATSVAGSMTDDAWYQAVSGLVDISSWTGPLRISLTCEGQVSATGDVGEQYVDVEYLAIEMWAR